LKSKNKKRRLRIDWRRKGEEKEGGKRVLTLVDVTAAAFYMKERREEESIKERRMSRGCLVSLSFSLSLSWYFAEFSCIYTCISILYLCN